MTGSDGLVVKNSINFLVKSFDGEIEMANWGGRMEFPGVMLDGGFSLEPLNDSMMTMKAALNIPRLAAIQEALKSIQLEEGSDSELQGHVDYWTALSDKLNELVVVLKETEAKVSDGLRPLVVAKYCGGSE